MSFRAYLDTIERTTGQSPADLRRALGVVMQDTWLMSGTLRQNIAFGSEFVTDAEVLEAATLAGPDKPRQSPCP